MTSFKKGQSLVEFAVMLPLLLILLLGVVEVVIFVGNYINLIDLTREAARYASTNDPFELSSINGDLDCSTTASFNFYYDISCVFSPLADPSTCTLNTNNCKWHNGFNSNVTFNSATDDILVTVFTVTSYLPLGSPGVVTNHWPDTGPWVWSDNDYDTAHNGNWQRSCDGTNANEIAAPLINDAYINGYMQQNAQPNKGFVVVEAFYCYHQVLGMPIISQLLPDPVKLHTYTIMPLPAAQPSATPKTP
jgi:Flp pilus assembly protein TadG